MKCPDCNREMRALNEGAWRCDYCGANWKPVKEKNDDK